MPEDARDDDEFKQELHQRVEDLSDKLHDIASQRKDEAEKERDGIMNDGWAVDHLGLLTNHYITLMQVSESPCACDRDSQSYHIGRNRPIPRCVTYPSRLLQINAATDS